MTPTEINEAIAKEMGRPTIPGHIPNYFGSLDACMEFQASLTPAEWPEYERRIETSSRLDAPETFPNWKQLHPSYVIDALLLSATAPQRCEAFLRVRGIQNEDAK